MQKDEPPMPASEPRRPASVPTAVETMGTVSVLGGADGVWCAGGFLFWDDDRRLRTPPPPLS